MLLLSKRLEFAVLLRPMMAIRQHSSREADQHRKHLPITVSMQSKLNLKKFHHDSSTQGTSSSLVVEGAMSQRLRSLSHVCCHPPTYECLLSAGKRKGKEKLGGPKGPYIGTQARVNTEGTQ